MHLFSFHQNIILRLEYKDIIKLINIDNFAKMASRYFLHINLIDCGFCSYSLSDTETLVKSKSFGAREGIFREEFGISQLFNGPGYYYVCGFVSNQDTTIYGKKTIHEIL